MLLKCSFSLPWTAVHAAPLGLLHGLHHEAIIILPLQYLKAHPLVFASTRALPPKFAMTHDVF
eukprot:scaffold291046_cov12-Tisochrysis_lutea.AAC.1